MKNTIIHINVPRSLNTFEYKTLSHFNDIVVVITQEQPRLYLYMYIPTIRVCNLLPIDLHTGYIRLSKPGRCYIKTSCIFKVRQTGPPVFTALRNIEHI